MVKSTSMSNQVMVDVKLKIKMCNMNVRTKYNWGGGADAFFDAAAPTAEMNAWACALVSARTIAKGDAKGGSSAPRDAGWTKGGGGGRVKAAPACEGGGGGANDVESPACEGGGGGSGGGTSSDDENTSVELS